MFIINTRAYKYYHIYINSGYTYSKQALKQWKLISDSTCIASYSLPYSGLFSKGKFFTNWPYPTFSRENFHKYPKALSAY